MAEPSYWTGELSLDRLPPLTPDQERAATAWRLRGRRAMERRERASSAWRAEEAFRLEEQVREAVAEFETKKAAA